MGIAVGDKSLTSEQRFWRRVDRTDSCWLWTGGRGGKGNRYGVFNGPSGHRGAHVVAYELLVGDLPDGYVIDHLCCVPLCVNPGHLEPVTPTENRRRQVARQVACRNGHEFSGSNLYVHGGKRYCRTCRNEAQKRYLARLACP